MSNKKDFATSTVLLAPDPADSGTEITIQSGHGARMAATPFDAVAHEDGVLPTLDNAEKVQVTDVTGDVLTIVRAQGDTTAKNIAVGWRISNAIFSDDFAETFDDLSAGTTNKAFTGTEKTKLAGIEDGADVTDTANVTAAGALMDSEVANLADVKAFDPTDYATAAQGATADSALQNLVEDTTPQLGGDLDLNSQDITGIDTSGLEVITGSTLSQVIASSDTAFLNARSTGVRYGGGLTDLGSGVVRIAAGAGGILDNSTPATPTYTAVTWSQTDLDLSATDDVYFIYVNGSGTVTSSTTVLPTNTTLLAPWGYRTNNATALAVGLDVMSAYIETDY